MHHRNHSPIRPQSFSFLSLIAALGLWVAACPGPEESSPSAADSPSADKTPANAGTAASAGSKGAGSNAGLPGMDASEVERSAAEAAAEITPENAEEILDALEAALAGEDE